MRDPAGPAPRLLDAWLAPGALILSAFVALRGDGILVALETGLDIYYLASLGDDALPILAEHRCDLPVSVATMKALDLRIGLLADDGGSGTWQAWNLSRERAKDLRFEAICLLSAR